MFNHYICAIDIGSNKIAASLAIIKKKNITNLFFETAESCGIKRGSIVNSIELTGSICRLLKSLKVKSGLNFKVVYANVSGEDIITKHSRAILPLAERGNKVITLSDIQRVNEQARILGSSLEEEIIHLIPYSYSIDSKNNILEPLGLYGHRLETDLFLVCVKLSSVQALSLAVAQAGYELKNLFFSGIATSKAAFGKEIKNGVNVLCDIGSDITELLIFQDGVLKNIEIIALGGDDLTFEIQEDLQIPFELAEDLKKSYSDIGSSQQITEGKEILIKKDNFYKPIKERQISEKLTFKVRAICGIIKKSVEKSVAFNQINNFVVSGRSPLLGGFIETMEDCFGIQVKLARIENLNINAFIKNNSSISGQKYLLYLTSLGIICDVIKDRQTYLNPINTPSPANFLRIVNKIKEVYQEYF